MTENERKIMMNHAAYARIALWMCIEKCDNDMIYCDTDSIFVEGNPDLLRFRRLNAPS